MKTKPLISVCKLQSVTYTQEGRVVVIAPSVPPSAGLSPSSKRRAPVKLPITAEWLFSFEPAIQVRSRAKKPNI
jgi:hypothetical protein